MHSKRKIPDSWRTGWKAKACTSFVLYLKAFKNHLYYLWQVRVLSIKPCLHTQLPGHNKSYRKVSWGWGHLITWNGPMMGHLNSFSASGGGEFEQKFCKKYKCPGVARGEMLKLRFDWYINILVFRSSSLGFVDWSFSTWCLFCQLVRTTFGLVQCSYIWANAKIGYLCNAILLVT